MLRILVLAEKATNNTQIQIVTFTSPREGTRVKTDGTVLNVTTTATNKVNSLSAELGHSRLTTHLELSLLNVNNDLSTGKASLMTRITANTYIRVRLCILIKNNKTYPLSLQMKITSGG